MARCPDSLARAAAASPLHFTSRLARAARRGVPPPDVDPPRVALTAATLAAAEPTGRAWRPSGSSPPRDYRLDFADFPGADPPLSPGAAMAAELPRKGLK